MGRGTGVPDPTKQKCADCHLKNFIFENLPFARAHCAPREARERHYILTFGARAQRSNYHHNKYFAKLSLIMYNLDQLGRGVVIL